MIKKLCILIYNDFQGGQRIDFFAREESENKIEELVQKDIHLYIELRGSITSHLMNMKHEKNMFYCFMPGIIQ